MPTVVIPCVDEAWAQFNSIAEWPDSVSDSHFEVGNPRALKDSFRRRGFIRFDFSDTIPHHSRIESAELRLTSTYTNVGPAASLPFQVADMWPDGNWNATPAEDNNYIHQGVASTFFEVRDTGDRVMSKSAYATGYGGLEDTIYVSGISHGSANDPARLWEDTKFLGQLFTYNRNYVGEKVPIGEIELFVVSRGTNTASSDDVNLYVYEVSDEDLVKLATPGDIPIGVAAPDTYGDQNPFYVMPNALDDMTLVAVSDAVPFNAPELTTVKGPITFSFSGGETLTWQKRYLFVLKFEDYDSMHDANFKGWFIYGAVPSDPVVTHPNIGLECSMHVSHGTGDVGYSRTRYPWNSCMPASFSLAYRGVRDIELIYATYLQTASQEYVWGPDGPDAVTDGFTRMVQAVVSSDKYAEASGRMMQLVFELTDLIARSHNYFGGTDPGLRIPTLTVCYSPWDSKRYDRRLRTSPADGNDPGRWFKEPGSLGCKDPGTIQYDPSLILADPGVCDDGSGFIAGGALGSGVFSEDSVPAVEAGGFFKSPFGCEDPSSVTADPSLITDDPGVCPTPITWTADYTPDCSE